jgi:hypothetical protein
MTNRKAMSKTKKPRKQESSFKKRVRIRRNKIKEFEAERTPKQKPLKESFDTVKVDKAKE